MSGEKAKGYLFPTDNLEYADRCYTRDPLIGQKLTVSLNYMKTELTTPKAVVHLCPRPLLLSCLGFIAERRFGNLTCLINMLKSVQL